MTDQQQDIQFSNEPPSQAALLRLEADGELPESWRGRLDEAMQEDPHAEDRLAFERALRFRVSKVMAGEAPAGLAERIRAALIEADTADTDAVSPAATEEAATRRSARRDTVYSFRTRLVRVAMAAVLTLLVGATGLILWRTQNGLGPINTRADVPLAQASSRLFDFVESQARTCGDFGRHFEWKMTVRELGEVPEQLSDHLNERAPAPDLGASGYRFEGAGTCAVPFYGPSLHYVYSKATSAGVREPLSLFVQRGETPEDMREGVLYDMTKEGSSMHIYTWCEDRMIYYIVPVPGDDPEQILEQMQAPTTEVNVTA
jgi:hypothetical protein